MVLGSVDRLAVGGMVTVGGMGLLVGYAVVGVVVLQPLMG